MNKTDAQPPDIATEFHELLRIIVRATYSTVLLSDCELQYARLLEFVRAHPDSRPEFVDCFQPILSDYITLFCMRHLQWPEVAAAARQRMRQDIHNSEYECLRRLLDVYEPTPKTRNV